MPDIRVAFDGVQFRGDFVLGAQDLDTGDELRTNILISLFTLPGWWANAYEADAWGSRLHELYRAKHSNDTLLRARDYTRQALRWLLEDRVASAVDVATAWRGSALLIGVVVTQATGITRFSFVWEGI